MAGARRIELLTTLFVAGVHGDARWCTKAHVSTHVADWHCVVCVAKAETGGDGPCASANAQVQSAMTEPIEH